MTFPVWEDETCGGCGKPQDKESKEAGEPFYKLTCPECYYEGCHECMPLGRGTLCDKCEELVGEDG